MKASTITAAIIGAIQGDDEMNLDLQNASFFFYVRVDFIEMTVYIRLMSKSKAFTRDGYFYLDKDYKTGNNFNFRKLRKDIREYLKVIEFELFFNRF